MTNAEAWRAIGRIITICAGVSLAITIALYLSGEPLSPASLVGGLAGVAYGIGLLFWARRAK